MKQHNIDDTQSTGQRTAHASHARGVGVAIVTQRLSSLWQRVRHVLVPVKVGRAAEGSRPGMIILHLSVVQAVLIPLQLLSARVKCQLLRHVEGVAIKQMVRNVRNDDRQRPPP